MTQRISENLIETGPKMVEPQQYRQRHLVIYKISFNQLKEKKVMWFKN